MSLINLTAIQDGDDANSELFNTRLGIIVNEINGNIDADNLSDNAVSTAKLAPTSVTPSKMALTKTKDANNWTVLDYGSWKEYLYTHGPKSATVRNNGGVAVFLNVPLPVDITSRTGYAVNFNVRGSGYMDHYIVSDNGAEASISIWLKATVDVPGTAATALYTSIRMVQA